MEDDDTLEDHGVRDKGTVHLVICLGKSEFASTEVQDERSLDQESIQEITDLQAMPIKAGWSGLWDI
jgi:hypothetical protein